MKRKVSFSLVVLVLLAFATWLAWILLGLPPARMVLKYGVPPYCAPTGKTMKVEGIGFVEIGPGCFRMGSHYKCERGDLLGRVGAIVGLDWGTTPKHDSNECPVHWVEFEEGYWIARTEVTNEQYELFRPNHGRDGESRGDRHPVVEVSWADAKAYCEWLSGKSGLQIRLPSDSEWESACRAGSKSEFCFGDDESVLPKYGWFLQNSENSTRPVGTRRPNAWGLHDLHGNASEWCEDEWLSFEFGVPADVVASRKMRILPRVHRGGSWDGPATDCRSSARSPCHPEFGSDYVGFRPAFTLGNGNAYTPEAGECPGDSQR